MANWQAWSDQWNQGSFVSIVPAPNADPAGEPTVCVQFAAAWLPYVLGSLFQLTQPSAWDPTSAGFADVLTQAQALMAIFSEGGECVGMLQFRCDPDSGVPQYSVDGGVTWIDLPDCFIGPAGPAGPTGPEGPAGGFSIGTPPQQPGQTTAELACSISGFLAAELIQGAINSAVTSITGGQTILQAAETIAALIPGLNVVLTPVLGAAAVLYNLINGGNLSHYEFAATDPVLLSALTCAIYLGTSTDGYVTDANAATVLANVAGISYTYPDVIAGINGFLLEGGEQMLEAAQIPGALAVVDCSGCGGPDTWCYFWNSAVAQGAWFFPFGSGADGHWVSGIGFVGDIDGSNVEIDIQIDLTGGGTIDSIEFNAAIFNTPGSSNFIGWRVAGVYSSTAQTLTNDGGIHTYGATPGVSGIDQIWIRVQTLSPAASPPYINAIKINGHGAANPFGTTNCT